MTGDLLGQIGLVLLVCVLLGAVAIAVRLPLLVGLLIAGVLVGPDVLGLVRSSTEIELLGEIGISLLLFVVGLKLDPRLVRKLGPVVLVAGTLQVATTAALAFVIARSFGTPLVPALYLAAGMSFSSTVVVIKLLADRGQIEQLQGRLALGILIVQDIVVIGLMVVLASIDPASTASFVEQFGLVALRGVALFVGSPCWPGSCSPGWCTSWPGAASSSCSPPSPGRWRWRPRRTCSGSARRSARSWPVSHWPRRTTARRSAGG
jgi:Kef-type K+ transport system membrane component KefB